MSTWVNFKEIKERVSIADIVDHYGLREKLKQKGSNLIGPCPIHKGTNPTQFHLSLVKNAFMCFGDCHGGGNVIDFIAKMEGVSIREAALLMQEWFGIEGTTKNDRRRLATKEMPDKPAKEKESKREAELVTKEKEEQVNPPLTFALQHLDPDHPYLVERGFTKETVAAFGVGYCQKGLMKGRIAIPIHNEQGELVAYAGRFPGDPPEDEPKYKLPAGFHKALVVFNLHQAREYARDQGLVLVEGFFDVMRLWQAGVRTAVALMGSSLSPEQEALIVDTVGPQGKVALMFDEDEAGWACRKDALTRLSTQVYVKVMGLSREGAQPDSLSEEEIRELGLLDAE